MVILDIDYSAPYYSNNDFILEGVTYNLITYWNHRSGWKMDLYSNTGESLALSRDVRHNISIFRGSQVLSGIIACIDTTGGTYAEVSLDNIGVDKRYQILYLSEKEATNVKELL